MSEEAKQAKADAKAAKARAKGLRPLWKKKRWWALALIAVVVIAAAASSGSGSGGNEADSASSGGNSSSSGEGSSDTISQGIGSKDASADIVDIDCGTPDAIGMIYPKVTVKNNSSKASDYYITITAESADGSMKYDDTPVFIQALQPGQTMSEEGIFTNEIPAGAVCKVTEVQRTAS